MKKKAKLREENGVIARAASKVRWFFYSTKCKIYEKLPKGNKKQKTQTLEKTQERLFLIAVLAIPLTVFAVFYIGVNINCIVLAFKDYDLPNNRYVWESKAFSHFIEFFDMLKTQDFMGYAMRNSVIMFVVSLCFNLPFHIFNAYYVYKKRFLHLPFKVLLFLPSILSSVVSVTMFKYFLIYGLQEIYTLFKWGTAPQLLRSIKTGFATTMVYSAWIGFGGSLILFLGLMNRISPSIIEAASLDGVTPFKEFTKIILPLIFPTISIYVINLIAGFFSAQGSLYTFYGSSARPEFYTFGYYYFTNVLGEAGVARYPMAAASGILFTLVVAPITLIARWLLDKFFPPIDY